MPPNSDNRMSTQTLRAAHYRRLPSIGTLYEIARYVREIAPIIMFQSKQATVSRYTKLTSTRESNVNLEVKKPLYVDAEVLIAFDTRQILYFMRQ